MKLKKILLIIGLLLTPHILYASTYYIPRSYYPGQDHGNAQQHGSIAWHFKQYGAHNTYVLTTPASGGSYGIYTPLKLPTGSKLISSSGGKPWIRAYANLSHLIRVSSSTNISNVILDGNYKVNHVIKGSNINTFTLNNSEVRRTKNNNGNTETKAHLIVILNSKNIKILSNVIKQAGDNGINVGTKKTEASGLYLTGNDNIQVQNNNINYVLSSGINTTNSINVRIINNRIDNTGRASKYDASYASDGITAYHNTRYSPNKYLFYTVTGNIITNWYNHGIHLSGKWLDIKKNYVYNPGLKQTTGHAIYVGDYRNRIRCSSIIWIQNNYVKRSRLNSSDAADGIRVHNYKWATYWPSRNRGDVANHVNVTDHRYHNLGNQRSCLSGYADQHY